MRKDHGFSLIELLIVVAMIIIIVSMAIPNLLRARMSANEASAVGSVRAINTAQLMYEYSYPHLGYASSLAKLGSNGDTCKVPTPDAACLVENTLASATTPAQAKSGYYFSILPGDSDSGRVLQYTVSGCASVFNQTGIRDLCSTEDTIVHFRIPSEQSTPGIDRAQCKSLPTL
ncbi:MAG TPA: prepilin-type N-terminal cleavage/methylation domain-containing protein [Terriglobales bacterium]|nr:prepilin-type N-terminal cleavage/methylation domain-containing protein [Terriglobales bacterium]